MTITQRSGWSRQKGTVASVLAWVGMLSFAIPNAALARTERAPQRTGAASQRPLEETVGAMRSAELLENAALHDAIINVDARAIDLSALGTFRGSAIQARVEPMVGPATPSHGPELRPERESQPSARGGGPRVTQSVAADRASSRGIEPGGVRTVSAPLGCSRIDAAGAPGVSRITLSIASQEGRVIAHTSRAGRVAALQFCPPTDGTYRIHARTIGGTVPDPVQIFVE